MGFSHPSYLAIGEHCCAPAYLLWAGLPLQGGHGLWVQFVEIARQKENLQPIYSTPYFAT